jgi:O-antigen/teichoic acid export membrane protein
MALTVRARWLRQIASARFQRLGRELIWISLGQGLAVLGALVGVRLLTSVLTPDIYGQLALAMTLALLVNQVLLGPLSGAALRFYAPAHEKGELSAFLAALRRLLTNASGLVLLTASIISVALLLAGQISLFWLAVATFSFALLSGLNSILDSLQNAARQRSIVAWHQALVSWGRYLLATGMVLLVGATSTVAMTGYALATFLVLLSQLWFFWRMVRPTTGISVSTTASPQRWRTQIFTYGWPFAAWGIFSWAQLASDRWALQMFATTQDVGLYAVLYQLGFYPIMILTGLMVQLVSPVLFRRAGDASDTSRMQQVYALNWRLTLGALLLTGVAALLSFALNEPIFRWLVAPDYRAVAWLLPGMALAGGLFATGQFASISVLSGAETRGLIAPKIATALLGASLNMLGAARWGITGVVCASAITAAVYLIWTLCLVKTRQNQALKAYG